MKTKQEDYFWAQTQITAGARGPIQMDAHDSETARVGTLSVKWQAHNSAGHRPPGIPGRQHVHDVCNCARESQSP